MPADDWAPGLIIDYGLGPLTFSRLSMYYCQQLNVSGPMHTPNTLAHGTAQHKVESLCVICLRAAFPIFTIAAMNPVERRQWETLEVAVNRFLGVANVWLAVPSKLNAMSTTMFKELPALMSAIDADEDIRVVR